MDIRHPTHLVIGIDDLAKAQRTGGTDVLIVFSDQKVEDSLFELSADYGNDVNEYVVIELGAMTQPEKARINFKPFTLETK
jgi:hypothetical protein